MTTPPSGSKPEPYKGPRRGKIRTADGKIHPDMKDAIAPPEAWMPPKSTKNTADGK